MPGQESEDMVEQLRRLGKDAAKAVGLGDIDPEDDKSVLKGTCENFRVAIGTLGDGVNNIKKHPAFNDAESLTDVDHGEVLANITLSYRHLEDARMRLGKAMQALDGGVSIYDKAKEAGATDSTPDA